MQKKLKFYTVYAHDELTFTSIAMQHRRTPHSLEMSLDLSYRRKKTKLHSTQNELNFHRLDRTNFLLFFFLLKTQKSMRNGLHQSFWKQQAWKLYSHEKMKVSEDKS